MGINLQKGQRVDLTKGNEGLSTILVGLGWDPVKKDVGFFGNLMGKGQVDVDCDASVLMLDEYGKVPNKENLIYFGNLNSVCGSIKHTGDNLTGEGDGDDEQIIVDLTKIPKNIQKLVFVVNIYDCIRRKQDFGLIQNAFIRVLKKSSNQELVKFNLSSEYAGKTTLLAAEIYRHGKEWKFAAVGEGTLDASLGEIVKKYQ
ncbi:MAG: TerD family protein [Clostridiales bacterium]